MPNKPVDLYPEFYNDVFGPIMAPGSSSHMAAPCRAGYMCNSLLGGDEVAEIVVEMDNDGSFKGTFGTMIFFIFYISSDAVNLPICTNSNFFR